MLILNKGQQYAYDSAYKWWHSPNKKQVWKLAGYAGTGKTTIVFKLIDAIGLKPDEVLFATYVGKATIPLRLQGLKAKTIHATCYDTVLSYVYDAEGKPIKLKNGTYKKKSGFAKKETLGNKIKLIVIDECAMVPISMSNDLKSFGIPIIAIGDPGQLPPVFGKSDLINQPDATLTEIMRQKSGDPIIYLATLARNGQNIPLGKYGKNCYVLNVQELQKNKRLFAKPDIMLCSTNRTREYINNTARYEVYKRQSIMPEVGDKMVNRKNKWEMELNGIPMINGLFGYVTNVDRSSFNGKSLKIDFAPECLDGEIFNNTEIDYKYLEAPVGEKNTQFPIGCCMEYGYGSTIYLAQGSQYDEVYMIDECYGGDDFHNKSLYTGITRAKKTFVLFKEPNNKYFYFK